VTVNPAIRLGADIGGTFTDMMRVCAGNIHACKVLAT
jgi:N-methylhydantoinase A/oxoprolinase/acetone carboxylase beta subunit